MRESFGSHKHLALGIILLPLFLAGLLSSGCGAIEPLEVPAVGDKDPVEQAAKSHLWALANSDSTGVCEAMSNQAEDQFSAVAGTVEGMISSAETRGTDMGMVPFDVDEIPADPIAYCRFDVDLSRDLLEAGDAATARLARLTREGFRSAYFGEPKLRGDETTARIHAGAIIDSQQVELAYGLTKEDGSWKIDFLDLRIPGEGEGRLFPTDVETAVRMWSNYSNGQGEVTG